MNYYDELEVSVKASPVVIKAAYKAQAKQYHPDIYRGDPRFSAQKLKNLNLAYETLSDPQKRQEYDYLNKIKTETKNNSQNDTKYQSYTESTYKSDINDDQEEDSDNSEFSKIAVSVIMGITIFIFLISIALYNT